MVHVGPSAVELELLAHLLAKGNTLVRLPLWRRKSEFFQGQHVCWIVYLRVSKSLMVYVMIEGSRSFKSEDSNAETGIRCEIYASLTDQ